MPKSIALINPGNAWSPNRVEPLGLLYIAAVLEQAGHNVDVFDLNAEKVRSRELMRKVANADIVGIGGMITEEKEILRLVRIVKEADSRTLVVLGGPMATSKPRELLQTSLADFIVMGEGERTIVDLILAIERNSNLEDIKGIAYRDKGRVAITEPVEYIEDLDSIPFPARHLLNMDWYLGNDFVNYNIDVTEFGNVKSTDLITSRGCPYSCTFCFKGMWGRKWRARSAENIVKEIKLLYEKYGANGFFFHEDLFVLDHKRVFDVCRLIRQEGLKVIWYCNGRVDLMTKDLLEVMYGAGCRGIAYGIESGNQRILDSIKKKTTLEQVRNTIKWTKEANINVCGYFMLGMLGETKANIEETLSFARELDLGMYDFTLTTPYPGTELYDSALSAGLISGDEAIKRDRRLNISANLTQDCSDSVLVALLRKAFREFYLEKRFGKYYFLNLHFFKIVISYLVSLRNRDQAVGLLHRVWSVIHK